MTGPTTRPLHRGRVTPLHAGAGLTSLLAGCWSWSVPDPSWGVPSGVVAFCVGLVLLARSSDKETET